jgi:hypothetical protein
LKLTNITPLRDRRLRASASNASRTGAGTHEYTPWLTM